MRDSQRVQVRSPVSECLNGEGGGHDVRGMARPAGGRAAARCAPERDRLERVAGPAVAARNGEQLLRFCKRDYRLHLRVPVPSHGFV